MRQHDQVAGPSLQNGWANGADHIPTLDIAGLLRAFWHGKWVILFTMALTITLAGYYAFRIATPQYVAMATLQMGTTGDPTGRTPQQPESDEAALNTKIALVTSDAVLTDVIAELGLLSDPELNRYLSPQSPLSLRNLRTQARHILAGTTAQTPDRAAIHEKTIQNLRGQLTVTRRPDTYILQISARSSDPDKAALLANTTAALYLAQTQALQAQTQAEAEIWLQSQVATLRDQLDTQEMQIAALVATAQLQQDGGLDALSAQVLATDQDLIAAQNTLTTLENATDNSTARNRAEIGQIRDKISTIADLKDRLSTQLAAQSAGLAELHQLQLQTDATRQLYQTFLERLQENRMQQGLSTPSAQRIAPASGGAYIGPRKMLILMIAAMLGGTLGVMLVVIRRTTHKGIVDARSLRDATGLPVLAQFSTSALKRLRKGRNAFPLPPQSEVSQTAYALSTALALVTRTKPAQVILSTSSIGAEGKAAHALFLAHALAQAGKHVVVLGADDHDRQFRALIGNADVKGAEIHSSALGADILIMPGISDQHQPLNADDLADRLDMLREHYDHIIIDGPPVLHGPLAKLFASHADAILYAVGWSKTPRDILLRGLEALEDVGCPATGLILSKVHLRKMRKLSSDPCVSLLHTAQPV
ncbi:uncharacterized protein involved in exopolysaccharide biosynthesis [Yoonia maricola]|uniref:Uncharacterized protein involved in exopolysaccharide biosynthesis n=1 Tax=Yoonia maricola TaxID=420999 RepID=A0A2M8W2F9_9RHOB|nr:Wzz/FepE/Etk N-terminal domain-containing protein [Yoonia maricola]PJI85115.1 uncharacterized protein involved in exopolysaccharide biosynthesis [Yoonia maricola]